MSKVLTPGMVAKAKVLEVYPSAKAQKGLHGWQVITDDGGELLSGRYGSSKAGGAWESAATILEERARRRQPEARLVKRSSPKAEPTVVEEPSQDAQAEIARVSSALARKVERAQEGLRAQAGHGGMEQLERARRYANEILEAQGLRSRYSTVYPSHDEQLVATFNAHGEEGLEPIRGTVAQVIAQLVERHAPQAETTILGIRVQVDASMPKDQARLEAADGSSVTVVNLATVATSPRLVVPAVRELARCPMIRAAWEGRLREAVPSMTEDQARELFAAVRERRAGNERAWGKLWNKSGSECKATPEQTVEYNTVACALGYAIRLLFKFHPQIQIERDEAKVALAQAQEQLEGLKVEVARLEQAAAEPRVERRLLVMACSATKRDDRGELPAIQRYDGPSFRVLRNFLGDRLPYQAGLDVWILSAEFGLIHWEEPIPNYDTRMDGFRANMLQGGIRRDLRNVLEVRQPSEAFLMLGKDYLEALGPLEGLGLPSTTIPEGGIGYKLGALKRWLEQRTEGK